MLRFGSKRYTAQGKNATWSKTQRRIVKQRDDELCVYCGSYGDTIDHVIPVSWGGPHGLGNAVLACRSCNTKKSAKKDIGLIARGLFVLSSHGLNTDWVDDLMV